MYDFQHQYPHTLPFVRGMDMTAAIFGGHISGKRSHGVKANPLFNDKNSISMTSNKSHDSRASDGSLDIEIYKNIPSPEKKPFKGKQSSKNGIIAKDLSMSEEKNQSLMNQTSERDSLKVTNGNILVGDIIIENGYHKDAPTQPIAGVPMQTETLEASDLSELKDVDKTLEEKGERISINDSVEYASVIKTKNKLENTDWPDINDISIEIHDKPAKLPDSEGSNDVFTSCEKMNNNKNSNSSNHTQWCEPVQKEDPIYDEIPENHSNGKVIITDEMDDVVLEHSKNRKQNVKKKIEERKNSVPENIHNCVGQRPIKPILVTALSNEPHERTHLDSQSSVESPSGDHKCVTFSQDTVFNENRPNKYKKEKGQIYKGDVGTAKSNPVFIDDDGIESSLTDDQKAARSYAKITSDLNLPSYMKEYIITSNGMREVSHKQPLGKVMLDTDVDLEALGGSDPRYDEVIKQTMAKHRRSRYLRLTFAFLAFLVVIAVVVLLVIYFGKGTQ